MEVSFCSLVQPFFVSSVTEVHLVGTSGTMPRIFYLVPLTLQ